MEPGTFAMLLAALGLTGAGAAVIYASWRGLLRSKRVAVPAGWASLVLAGWPWSAIAGVELGIVYTLLVPSIAAWLLVAANVDNSRSGRKRRAEEARMPAAMPGLLTVLKHVAAFIVAVPLAAFVSASIALGLSRLLPWSEVNRTAFVLVSTPVLWGFAAFWAVADPKPLRSAGSLVACGLVTGAILFL